MESLRGIGDKQVRNARRMVKKDSMANHSREMVSLSRGYGTDRD
jgi:hypothetical protein